MKCIERRSSEIKVSEQQLKAATKLEDVAKQPINPELEVESVVKGSDKSETTASLLFTLRLGGKKDALINEAKAELQKAQAGHDQNIQQARLAIMLSLYRLMHLKSETSIEEETGATFSKIVSQYQKSAALSPEQRVSLSIFKMALSDHQLRFAKLKAEEDRVYLTLYAMSGFERSVVSKFLPQRKVTWPELALNADDQAAPQLRQSAAQLRSAQSLMDKADSEAWPDIRVGPSVRATKDGAESDTFVGIGFQMPLPIFSLNQGAKSYQAQRVIEAEMVLAQTKQKLSALRSELSNRYVQTVKILRSSLSLKDIGDKHEEVERQFFKGLVPSSLVIEAHRQLFELEERRNASELDAIEAYGQLLILNGEFEGVII